MREGPPFRMPRRALMGSSGSGSIVIFVSLDSVTKTLSPGLSRIASRSLAGITTCPLADVFTMGIVVHRIVRLFNSPNESITWLKSGVNVHSQPKHRDRHSVVSHNNERLPPPISVEGRLQLSGHCEGAKRPWQPHSIFCQFAVGCDRHRSESLHPTFPSPLKGEKDGMRGRAGGELSCASGNPDFSALCNDLEKLDTIATEVP